MPDEAARKKMALDYAQRINAGDIEGVLDLFADDIVFEDPVGRPPMVGKDDLRRHLELAVSCGTYEVPDPPMTSMDDRFVVTPTTVTVQRPRPMTFRIVGIVELDENGLGRRVQAFWGVTDVTMDEPGTTGTAAVTDTTHPEGTRA
ncbi:nuclear transport factor 2 family protein [Streptomyces olivoreticuli]|uniref:nuclear transport factor 2 family protein n=1 Tax=Streptomyces olivoreticuli TaxID=68246 RepID=UPI000E245DF2|nr:nuclear transport factor 2 family protein [Streptomyces olivoreticuli]